MDGNVLIAIVTAGVMCWPSRPRVIAIKRRRGFAQRRVLLRLAQSTGSYSFVTLRISPVAQFFIATSLFGFLDFR